MNLLLTKYKYYSIIVLIFAIAFSYIFNSKIDLNGDNVYYYLTAKAISEGNGMSLAFGPYIIPTNGFPPGYPFLLSLVMLFTKNIVVLKIFNGLLFLASSLIFFNVLQRFVNKWVAILATCSIFIHYALMNFVSILMSEVSFILTINIAFLCLWKIYEVKKNILKNPYFYILIFTVAFSYHIRSAAITLFLAVIFHFLSKKEWKKSIFFVAGFVLLCIPWKIRNTIHGFGGSRYLDAILKANIWRPEQGNLDLVGMMERLFDNLLLNFSKSIPMSLFYDLDFKFNTNLNFVVILVSLVTISIIFFGWFKLPKFKFFIGGFIASTILMVSLWSGNHGLRYMSGIIPLLFFLFVNGSYQLSKMIGSNMGIKIVPFVLIIIFYLGNNDSFNRLRDIAIYDYPPPFKNYFSVAKGIKDKVPRNTVVGARKPNMFSLFSDLKTVRYCLTKDDKKLIKELIKNKVNYVVVDNLGYASTELYLVPAINKNPHLFEIVFKKEPSTILLRFKLEEAKKIFYN